MATILFRQSNGTIGDMFFTSHYMYHNKLLGNKVLAAIPTNLNPEIKEIYNHFNFIEDVVELPFFLDDDRFISYCSIMSYSYCRFLLDLGYLKGLKFYPMNLWFKNDTEPTIDTSNSIGFQVSSSSNYDRPIIPYLTTYLEMVEKSGSTPVFFGTKEDENNFIKNYPNIYSIYCNSDISWRFGKDTLLQTIANIKNLKGHIVFSSGLSPIAVFYGVPVLELWTKEQWQFYSPIVHYMMGSPIHHIMQPYDEIPSLNLIKDIFPRLKNLSVILYGIK